jgi:hypothetical protein
VLTGWIAIGAFVALLAAVIWLDWRRDRLNDEYQRHLEARMEELEHPVLAVEPRAELTEQQLRDLRVSWPLVSCVYCGTIHQGTCPRVREVRYHQSGNPERTIFWREDKWSTPRGAISAQDVYGTTGVPAPEEATT